ncbi:hypothetical protein [Pleomorphovibrio marinus]|uniref:hypothetical protein n=1 Tax=Pleomorphovibrio marinus TaxID=2164132 RepID=UPI000E0C26EA|nr:hypothetical protein [Pleomorphovibrio marinus]
MKLLDFVLLPLAAALVIIGAHVTLQHGVGASYPIFMFSVVLLIWFLYRKRKMEEKESQDENLKGKPRKNSKPKKTK